MYFLSFNALCFPYPFGLPDTDIRFGGPFYVLLKDETSKPDRFSVGPVEFVFFFDGSAQVGAGGRGLG